MIGLVKLILSFIVKKNFLWRPLNIIFSPIKKLYQYRRSFEQESKNCKDQKYDEIFSGGVVLNGKFKGMKYPKKFNARTYYPKLLGSYESELNVVIEKLFKRSYDLIIDIGCADGYYAVGFALKFPNSLILAYDTDSEILELCREMSVLNKTQERIVLGGLFTKENLMSLDKDKSGLIFCDCEGYERYLFDIDVANHLRNYDFIIETHDFIQIDISTFLTKSFIDTHKVELIKSNDDILKAKYYLFNEINNLPLRERYSILKENRPNIMEWIVALKDE